MTRIVKGIAPHEYGAATLFIQCRRARMAKPKPEKKPAGAYSSPADGAPGRGDRLVDETGEWEVAGRPYTSSGGKTASVRVRKVGRPDVTEIRTWGAHERVAVRRADDGRESAELGEGLTISTSSAQSAVQSRERRVSPYAPVAQVDRAAVS